VPVRAVFLKEVSKVAECRDVGRSARNVDDFAPVWHGAGANLPRELDSANWRVIVEMGTPVGLIPNQAHAA